MYRAFRKMCLYDYVFDSSSVTQHYFTQNCLGFRVIRVPQLYVARNGDEMAKRATKTEAKEKRVRELTQFSKEITEHTLAPEMDEDAHALYWIGPWDRKVYQKDEKGKWKKVASGDLEFVMERDPMPAIQMYLAAFKYSPRALDRLRNGFFAAGAHRGMGFLEDRKLLTSRDFSRNWHRRLKGWTVNVHILQNSERFGFDAMNINGKIYSVEYLLNCPPVPRRESGGFEKNLLLVDLENLPRDPLAASDPVIAGVHLEG
jgi:hypothetical protein